MSPIRPFARGKAHLDRLVDMNAIGCEDGSHHRQLTVALLGQVQCGAKVLAGTTAKPRSPA